MHNTKIADTTVRHTKGDAYELIKNNHVELSKFVETIEMMI